MRRAHVRFAYPPCIMISIGGSCHVQLSVPRRSDDSSGVIWLLIIPRVHFRSPEGAAMPTPGYTECVATSLSVNYALARNKMKVASHGDHANSVSGRQSLYCMTLWVCVCV